MLVLTRRLGQQIIIGNDITITVLALNNGTQVKLGVSAPSHIPVDREEIRKRKQETGHYEES